MHVCLRLQGSGDGARADGGPGSLGVDYNYRTHLCAYVCMYVYIYIYIYVHIYIYIYIDICTYIGL